MSTTTEQQFKFTNEEIKALNQLTQAHKNEKPPSMSAQSYSELCQKLVSYENQING
jgi:hypothetical protein